MDGLGRGGNKQFAAGFFVKGVRLEEQARPLEGAQQIGLGQRRALIGRIGLVAHHGDGTLEAFAAQGLDCLLAGLAGADNDDVFAGLPCPLIAGNPRVFMAYRFAT